MAEMLRIQVVYALAERQEIVDLTLPPGSTVGQAVDASRLLEAFPQIDKATNKVGIHGRLTTLDAPLRDGDRVEIYRPLSADLNDLRRRRAGERKAEKKMSASGGR